MAEWFLDFLAMFGMAVLVSGLWEHIEVALYGFSQHSVVDAFFGVFFSIVVVLGIKVLAALGADDWEDGAE